jgi:hypothetical protein
MPICMGVLCERCRTVYFISSLGTSTHVAYYRARGEFRVVCDPPCSAITYFQKDALRAYAIALSECERGSVSIKQLPAVESWDAAW